MDERLVAELVETNRLRADFCKFLASIYLYELSDEQIERFAAMSFEDDGSLVSQGYARILEYLRHRNVGTRQELAVDYAHTFLGAGVYDAILAPPYESVFTSAERSLMQDARDGVLAYYRSEELRLPEDNTEPEDHLGFELQFMAMLIERGTQALLQSDEERFKELATKQSSFLRHHLENWTPEFCDAIDEHAKTEFYRGVAQLTRGHVRSERMLLDGLLEELSIVGEDAEILPAWAGRLEEKPLQESAFVAIKREAEALGAVAPEHD